MKYLVKAISPKLLAVLGISLFLFIWYFGFYKPHARQVRQDDILKESYRQEVLEAPAKLDALLSRNKCVE